MIDYSITLKNKEEVNEAQEILFSMGCVWQYNGMKKITDVANRINVYKDKTLTSGHPDPDRVERFITLQELRTLAKKEYLDENFNLVYGSGVYEVPEGADCLTLCNNVLIFWKGQDYSFDVEDDNDWVHYSDDSMKLNYYLDFYKDNGVSTVWQRNNKCADTPQENDHYYINVSDVDEIDFYEIALRYNVTDPCIQHILKKCLAVGNRGHKDFHTDLKDIAKTANRMLVIHGVD